MSDEELIAALAEVLDDTATGLWMGQHGPGWGRTIAVALLPVVRAYGDLRAAEELRAAAAELHVLRFNADENPDARWPHGAPRVAPDSFYKGVVLSELALKARAAALTAREEAGR